MGSFNYFRNVILKCMHSNAYSNSAHIFLCTHINAKLTDCDCVWIRYYAVEGHIMFICLKLLRTPLATWQCVDLTTESCMKSFKHTAVFRVFFIQNEKLCCSLQTIFTCHDCNY
jgi:hypothetical protein